MKIKSTVLLIAITAVLSSKLIAADLTYGAVKQSLRNGETTQREVITEFGSPDNMVSDSKGELWIYDKVSNETVTNRESSQKSKSSGAFATIGIVGGNSNTGEGQSSSTTSVERTTKTITVILEFDRNGILVDHSIRTSKF